MKMTRQELEDHLVDYLYDELSEPERRRFEEALDAHPDLRAEVAAHRRTREAMSGLSDEPLPDDLLDGVMREARAAVTPPDTGEAGEAPGLLDRLLALVMQPAFAAAMLFLVVGGTALFLSAREEQRATEGEPAIGEVALREAPKMEAEPRPDRAARDPAPTAEPEARLAEGSGVPSEEEQPEAEPEAAPDEVALAEAEPARSVDEDREREALGDSAGGLAKAEEPAAAGKAAPPERKEAEERRIADALRTQDEPAARKQKAAKRAPSGTPFAVGYDSVEEQGEAQPRPKKRTRRAAPAEGAPAPEQDEANAAPAEPWREVERALERADEPDTRGEILLAAHDRFVREGREALAGRALDALEDVPGWEKVARSRRAAGEARRARKEAADEERDEATPPADSAPAEPASTP
ncbi:MAG: anti-sigma factor family protein [Myxococcota bacterium]